MVDRARASNRDAYSSRVIRKEQPDVGQFRLTNAASQITGAIKQAARSTGISFEYLLTAAKIRSISTRRRRHRPRPPRALYQFIEQTWLGTIDERPANGYGNADAISRSADGRYAVADPTMRADIMRLRGDPAASAMIAGSFTRSNAEQLRNAIGRPFRRRALPRAFSRSRRRGKNDRRSQRAATRQRSDMFPQAAAAIRASSTTPPAAARSSATVYKLTGRFETARARSFAPDLRTTVMPAVATVSPASAIANVIATVSRATAIVSPTATIAPPDTAGVTRVFADATATQPSPPKAEPLFQSMFTDPARKAVTQTVSSLWAMDKSATPAQPARPLDLFTDSATDTRKLFRGSV